MPKTTAGSSSNLHSQLNDKAKHTAALIQEMTEELQAIEEESSKDDQDADATQVNKRIVMLLLLRMNND